MARLPLASSAVTVSASGSPTRAVAGSEESAYDTALLGRTRSSAETFTSSLWVSCTVRVCTPARKRERRMVAVPLLASTSTSGTSGALSSL